MRNFVYSMAALPLLFAALAATAVADKPNLTGTWKLDPSKSEMSDSSHDPVLTIQEKDENIHFKEAATQSQNNDVLEFTCGTMGRDCPMQDRGEKAEVSAYYNGPVLILLKTHGRRGSSVEKRRLTLSAKGDSLVMEVIPIDPPGRTEKLVFTKAQ